MEQDTSKREAPSRKLGIKYLDDNQLTNSFPDWKALLARIEEQRQIAEFARGKSYQPEEGRFPQAYDNLFAVLGGRGSGKSSVLLTLREKIRHASRQDILLPIITPEVISEQECSILGWIMSATEQVVSSLERWLDALSQRGAAFGQEPNPTLDPFFKDCRLKATPPLRQKYLDLFEKSVSTSGTLDTSSYSAEDAVVYRVMQSRRQYKLIQDLNQFWDELSNAWYETRLKELGLERSSSQVKRPLIILMFDDIDLVPERSMELLTTTFQYFTNPNIVIILTASEKILKEVIRLKMMERMVGSKAHSLLIDVSPWSHGKARGSGGMLDQFETDSAAEMAQEFYDKVIPPSSRYKLRRYESISEKFLYAYSSTEQSFWAPATGQRSSIPLKDFLIDQVNQLAKFFPKKSEDAEAAVPAENFLIAGKGRNAFQEAYLLIFGVKSRNIANGCLEIMNTFDRLKKLREHELTDNQPLTERDLTPAEHEEVLLAMRHLVQALLLSKKDLAEYAGDVHRFLHAAPDGIGNYMDYDFASQCYDRELRDIRDWFVAQQRENNPISSKQLIRLASQYLGKVKQKIAALMMVMFFAEGILVITDRERRHIHGHRQLNRLLNTDVIIESKGRELRTRGLALFPKHQETQDFLHQSPQVLEHIDCYVGVNQYDYQYARKYLEDTFRARMHSEDILPIVMLKQAANQDLEWVKMVLSMLAVRYSGITCVEPRFIQALSEAQKRLDLFSFAAQFIQRTEQAAKNFMMGGGQQMGRAANIPLAEGDLIQVSRRQMKEFLRLIQQPYQWTDILRPDWDPFFLKEHGIDALQKREDQYNSLISSNDQDQSYIKAYLYHRWRVYVHADNALDELERKGDTDIRRCYLLVRFVEDTLTQCVERVTNQTDIHLTREQIDNVLSLIHRVNNHSLRLKRKKDVCLSQLERAALRAPSLHMNAEEAGGQLKITPGGPDSEPVWRIHAAPLIEYLAELQGIVLDQTPAAPSIYYYYDQSDTDIYFSLISFLAVSYRPAEGTLRIGEFRIPESSALISDMKMLEFLLPYYFSAHMGIAVSSRYRTELPPSEDYQASQMDQKLQELFQNLAGRKSSPKQTERLRRLMWAAQRELAEDYYSSLEARHE